MPNKLQLITDSYNFEIDEGHHYKIKILDDKKVLAVVCEGNKDCSFERNDIYAINGTWDILYRESLMV